MCIDILRCADIEPSWSHWPDDLYLAHPSLRIAYVRFLSEPETVYVVSDEPIPTTLAAAVAIIEAWRLSNVQVAA